MGIIEEAKKRYPIGTRFFPAHISVVDGYCVVVDHNFEGVEGDYISSLLPNGDLFSRREEGGEYDPKYGDNCYNRYLFWGGKWAKILSKPFKTYELW